MALQVLQMVLPIVALLALGMVCRRRNIFDMKGLAGLKAVVGDICLPVVLFNAFFTAKYSHSVALIFVLVYPGFAQALGLASGTYAGSRTASWQPPTGSFSPFCWPARRAVCWATPCTVC